jgi:peroxiredoxin
MHTILTLIAATAMSGTHLPASMDTDANSELTQSSLNTSDAPELLIVGDTIEDFTITTPFSPTGSSEVTLSTLLEDGPVILTFFRGSWCPYCRGELSDIQDRIGDLNELGATVLAISPELNEKSTELGEELELDFYIGHDENNDLARSLGLTFKLDGKTIKKYHQYNINVPDSNGTKKWELPIPATYVIDQDMTVRFVFDDENYSKRANYKKVLKVVEELQAED